MIPPLTWLCLRVLADCPAVAIDVRLNFDPRHAHLLHALPPPLWAALVQVYDCLPAHLRSLEISLADPHLSRLQDIPHTPLFSLITLLDLPACPHLNDTSIVHLRRLHSLVALDASATSLSSYAIKVLAGTLLWVDDGPQRRGPWSLRILRLRFCDKIDDSVYSHLAKFPLLTVIDLRGTKCCPPKVGFEPSSRSEFFHPAPLAAALDALEGDILYTSTNVFHLLINSLKPSTRANNDVMDEAHDESIVSQCSTSQLESDIISLESTPDMFYSQQSSRSSRPIKYDLVNDYRATTYYKWVHLEIVARPPGFHDSELALFRTPPAWSTLEERSTFLLNETNARRSTKREADTRVASINRTERIFQMNQGRIDALRESASTRRRSGGGAPSNTSEAKQTAGVQGKNPFRRYSVPSAVEDLNNGMKELIPISAVEVPKLPQNLNSRVDVKNLMRSDTTAETSQVKSSPIMGPSLRPARTWSGHKDSQLWKSTKHTPSFDSPRVNAKKSRVDGESGLSDKGRKRTRAEDQKSFDWNAWSTK